MAILYVCDVCDTEITGDTCEAHPDASISSIKTAHAFYHAIYAQVTRPSKRKLLHRLRKHRVVDTFSELHWFFGLDLTREELQEFLWFEKLPR